MRKKMFKVQLTIKGPKGYGTSWVRYLLRIKVTLPALRINLKLLTPFDLSFEILNWMNDKLCHGFLVKAKEPFRVSISSGRKCKKEDWKQNGKALARPSS